MGKTKNKRKAQKLEKAKGRKGSSKNETVASSPPPDLASSEGDPPSDSDHTFDEEPLPDDSPKAASSPPCLSPSLPAPSATRERPEAETSGDEAKPREDESATASTSKNTEKYQEDESTNASAPEKTDAAKQILTKIFKSNFYLFPSKIERKSTCTVGKTLSLKANFYPFSIKTETIYHYDIEIIKYNTAEDDTAPDKKLRNLNSKLNRKIFEEARKVIDVLKDTYPVYDGNRNFFTREKLAINERLERIFSFSDSYNPTHSDLYKIYLQPAYMRGGPYKNQRKKKDLHVIDLEQINDFFKKKIKHLPEETLLALGSIFRHCPSLTAIPVRHSFYREEEDHEEVTKGLELWYGYNYFVHVGQDNLYLNIDQAHTLFYPRGKLIDWIKKIVKRLNFESIREIENEIKKVKLYVDHLPFKKIYTNFTLTLKDCNHLEFEKDGTLTNLVDYYRDQYNIELKYAFLPAINVFNKYKPIFYPIELCYIKENQPYLGNLTAAQRTDIISHSTCSPSERFRKIENHLKILEETCKPVLREYNIEIIKRPLNVPARILSPPFLLYGNNKSITPDNGIWKTLPYYSGASLEHWVVISFVKDPQLNSKLLNMIENLMHIGKEYGLTIKEPSFTPSFIDEKDSDFDIKDILSRFKDMIPSLQLIVIILSLDTVKCNIKDTGDNYLSIPTLCIKYTNVIKKCNDKQFLINICHKVNIKLNGINYCLETKNGPEALKRPILIVGADVNHPPANNKTDPSVAAIVGNISRSFNHYEAQVRTQKTRLEIIADLKEMMKNLLNAFIRENRGRKPFTLLFFRDGVGEGQFEEVLDKELKYIKEACLEVCGNEHPLKISIVIVQKRHHVRFSPVDSKQGVGKDKNIPPGTLIELGVTHPYRFEYFLCSHSGIQGTSIPTKYTLIHDENDFTPNDLCTLTYYLCYMYTRCTRSIALPVVVQHAHHWALKGKGYYDAADDNFEEDYQDEGSD